MAAPSRLSPVARLDAAELLVNLSATAIRLHHPQSHALARITPSIVLGWDAERITNAIETMQAWIASQPPDRE